MYQISWADQHKNQKKEVSNNNQQSKNFFTTGKILLILSILIIIISITAFSQSNQTPAEFETIIVEPGETLWQIARENYNPQENLRKVIYEIRETNDLDNVILNPGQELKLPAIH